MLELRGVRHRYEGRVVLDLEQFSVPRTAAVAVVGHNGAGKSTLLRLLALLEAPTEGQVFWNGTAVPRRPAASLRRRVTLVEQRPVLFRGTVRENLEYGLRVREIGQAAANGIIADVVEISIRAANRNIERCARCQAQDRREAQLAENLWRVESS